jgi:hypothetical protein
MAVDTPARPHRHHHPGPPGSRPDHRPGSLHQPRREIHPPRRQIRLPLRGIIFCRDCGRRLTGRRKISRPGGPSIVYYGCTHDRANPRHIAAHPDHPRTVQVRQDLLHACLIQFFTERIFGPERHALLAAALPGNTTAAARQHDAETEKLRQRIRHIDTAEDAHTREIEHLTALPADSPAITALRTRIYARFTELEHERAQLTTRLHALTTKAPTAPANC